MTKQEESLAKNEGLYRRVNERIEAVSDNVPRDDPGQSSCVNAIARDASSG